MSISAFIPVYNEEKRLRYALTSLQWCDEIILIDKSSTDNTVEIAKEYGAKVYVMPNTNAYNVQEFDYFKYCSSEWIILFTASDIIDVELAFKIKEITSNKNFEYDIIEVPYKRYILGLENKRSPWYGKYASILFKKSTLKINKNEVHGALELDSVRKYKINMKHNEAIHHLTHETADIMMERHIRYWRAEGDNYNESTLNKAFKSLISTIKYVFIDKKTYLMGWNGIALICSYMSYFMMSFVYKWEKNNKASEIYHNLRETSIQNWEIENTKND